jgi:uncharacterized cupredoxin-like copper-binding protein
MENNQSNVASSKKILVLVGVLAVIVIVAVIVALTNKKPAEQNAPVETGTTTEQGTETGTTTEPAPVDLGAINPELAGAKQVVTGASPVKENKVVTMEGKPVLNDAAPMSPQAPQQTAPISKETVASNGNVLKIDVSATGFNPKEFTVKPGAVMTIAVTSVDEFTHIFAFSDPSLEAVAVGLAPGETRAITFNAPAKAGEYEFKCGVPGHAGRGEVGKMIVK